MFRLTLTAALLATPGSAWALSCASGPTATFPTDGATDVPLNARPRIVYSATTPAVLPVELIQDNTGTVVTATLEPVSAEHGTQSVWVMDLDGELSAETTYRVEVVEEQWVLATFTTGTERDTTPPSAPRVLGVRRESDRGEWGPSRYNAVELEPSTEPVMYLVDVASDPSFGDVRTAHVLPWNLDGSGPTEVSVGTGPCGGALELAPADRHIRVRAIDLAGNISSISESERAGSCSSLPSWGAGNAMFLALAVLLGRRRRHR